MDEQSENNKANQTNGQDLAGVPSRRAFLRGATAVAGATTLLASGPASIAQTASAPAAPPRSPRSSYLDLLRNPDAITAFDHFDRTLPSGMLSLTRNGNLWVGANSTGQVEVESKISENALALTLSAPAGPIAVVHVRWNLPVSPDMLLLGDAWERSYGELGWRNIVPERPMPWYFATWDRAACHGYGVKTDARALCFWQVDSEGVSLWLNVTNGGSGVELGPRRLAMATVVAHKGADGQDAFDAIAALCRAMCARPSRKLAPIFGANDWNYAYGSSTAETIVRDTEFIAGLAPTHGPRPFSVVDGGWENGTAAWPDMGKLAANIRNSNVRPGLWVRPLEAPHDAGPLLLPDSRFGERKDRAREFAYDPTVPEARQRIAAKLQQARDWGYELVKHDFSTYDLLGQWGFEMGPQPTMPGWSLADKSQTNAEVLAGLYTLIRETAGDAILIDGCNTVGHLGQGIFEMQRTGDDTSGRQWERTRRMGVNTAAFRLPQNGVFFTIDPDMAGITPAIPWELNRQWLDMLARSGAMTIVAPGPAARGPEQQAAIKDAFAIAAAGGVGARPLDWMETTAPERWRARSGPDPERIYRWSGQSGASPFLGP
jgi:alpha-galactosidase